MKSLLNKIYLADCFQLMAQIPNDSVDLVVVDPPYGIGYGIILKVNQLFFCLHIDGCMNVSEY